MPHVRHRHAFNIGVIACLACLFEANAAHAQYQTGDLPSIIQQQQKQIEEQQRQIKELSDRMNALMPQGNTSGIKPAGLATPAKNQNINPSKSPQPAGQAANQPETAPIPKKAGDAAASSSSGGNSSQAASNTAAIKSVVSDFLKENPGAGMPPSLQTGFEAGRGFVIRSAPNLSFPTWQDESPIPFELRIRGRVQMDYYYYGVQDNTNHLTGQPVVIEPGNESLMMVKRFRPIFEGHVFTPNLRYHFQLNASTRGLPGFQNNRIVETAGTPPEAAGAVPGLGTVASPIGGAVTDNHAVQLFAAFVAYDIPLGGSGKGCRPDCPDGTYFYSPTLSFVVGKQQPFFGFTEILGSANAQLVDFAMADWFFDADDNNLLMAVSIQLKAFDDRLFATAQVTNGDDSQFPAYFMDNYPGLITGLWYDFGGTWNEKEKRWELYGDSTSDLNYSVNPVVRVGATTNLVPLNRRSLYGDVEQSRVLASSAAPVGGTRMINLLNGGAGTPPGVYAEDKFNSYSFDSWASLHYRGFSLTNEWWCRMLNGFRSAPPGGGNIIYQNGTGANSLFPTGRTLVDVGTLVEMGYFVVPKKLELVSRYSMVSGDSGDINGNGTFRSVRLPGVANPVRVIDGAFTHFHTSTEVAVGFNYYFYGQLVKWSSDVSYYQGGNPAAGGASAAGYIPGVDGWLARTQLQLAF